ncbi:hypothetical protein CMI37_13230 [Candidatus Pacearchaeota archaeon]|nr:hypothetical protein [Candidatus Pacearchaeota archaeon]
MGNGNREYIDSKNYKDPSLEESLNYIPDTELALVDGEMSEINRGEQEVLTLLDAVENDTGIRLPFKEGDVLEAMGGSGDINPESGRRRYQQEGGDLVGNVGKSVGLAQTMTSAAGMMTGGAAATTGAALAAAAGPLALVALVGSVWKGANDAAKANRKKMKTIGQGIAKINDKRVQLGERAREDIGNIWEGVGSKLSDIRYGIGEKFEGLSGTVDKVVRRGKGLATGAAEEIISETTTNVQEGLTRETENLTDVAEGQIDIYGRKMEDETESMTMEIQDMNKQIDELSKKQYGYQNILS